MPGAVAGVRVGALCAAVLEVRHCAERAVDRLVGRLPVQPRDERDTARVVLERRVVETAGGRRVDAGWALGVRQIASLVERTRTPPVVLVGGGGREAD